jgi:hypothetical protein
MTSLLLYFPVACIVLRPLLRQLSSFSFEESQPPLLPGQRRLLESPALHVPSLLYADYIWDKMYTGTGVRVRLSTLL